MNSTRMIMKERSKERRKLNENEMEEIQVDVETICLKQYHVIQEGRMCDKRRKGSDKRSE